MVIVIPRGDAPFAAEQERVVAAPRPRCYAALSLVGRFFATPFVTAFMNCSMSG
jgi:hypothetical protein